VRYYAWLNPMPSECWRQTTGEEIARFVPMFEMSPQGMNAAISVLRGRYIVLYSARFSALLLKSRLRLQAKFFCPGKSPEISRF